MGEFCEQRRRQMEALVGELEAAEGNIKSWSGADDTMTQGQAEVETKLRERFSSCLTALQGALGKDMDETACILEKWTEGTTSDGYVEEP